MTLYTASQELSLGFNPSELHKFLSAAGMVVSDKAQEHNIEVVKISEIQDGSPHNVRDYPDSFKDIIIAILKKEHDAWGKRKYTTFPQKPPQVRESKPDYKKDKRPRIKK